MECLANLYKQIEERVKPGAVYYLEIGSQSIELFEAKEDPANPWARYPTELERFAFNDN